MKYLRERRSDTMTRIRTLWLSLLVAVVAAGYATAAPNKPKSVIHVITIQWKTDATTEQIQKAIRAAENINFPGIKNVWTKPIKMQLPEGYKHIIVMEFESEEALKSTPTVRPRSSGTTFICPSGKRAARTTLPIEREGWRDW